jgi:glutamyl-tRNA reductase
MERYLVVGTSFKESDGALRDVFHLPSVDRDTLRDLHHALGASELVYVATCNRVEFVMRETRGVPDEAILERLMGYFAVKSDTLPTDAWRGAFHIHRGPQAIRHLFRVTSSLDSMVVGEAQILGQVKRAYHAAVDAGTACSYLECLFEEAFRCARRVRRDTSLGAGSVSMASLAVSAITSTDPPSEAAVALVGSGEMTSKVAMFLAGHGFRNLCLVNRTAEKVRELAERHQANVVTLDDFHENPPPVDILVTATSAPAPIFTARSLAPVLEARGAERPLLIVDLAAPRDSDPELDTHPGVRVVTIDDLREESRRNSEKRACAIDAAARGVAVAAESFPGAMKRRLVDMICVDPVAAGMI